MIRINGTQIAPGERKRIEIPAARLTTGSLLSLPVEVLNGKHPGPRLWLSGAIHGDELNGVEIIRQLLSELRPKRLSGSVIAVPIVNVFGFVAESRYLPDRRDLNRSFPGSRRGSLASHLANLFMEEVVHRCDYGIDLHTGSDHRTNLPQIRADLNDPETRRLASAFGTPIIIHAAVRDGSLRAAATKRGARVLVFEGGEARRFNAWAVDAGVLGIRRVMEALGMLEPRRPPGAEAPPPPVESRKTEWVRAGRSGILRLETRTGEAVRKGERIGVITDSFGERMLPVRARRDGIVIGLTLSPLVNRGDALVHVAEPFERDAAPEGRHGKE
jgi:uncharacterized protein